MKAKDPSGGPDIDVTFPSGPGVQEWENVCLACGAVVGGCLSGPGLPEPRVSRHAVCPHCPDKTTIALRRCERDEDEATDAP